MCRKTLCLILLTSTAPCYAQVDTLALPVIEVQATRLPVPLINAGRHLISLDSTVLASAPSERLGEVLRSHSAVDVRQRSAFDVQTDIGIRGGTFDQSLVLVDGIPMNDPQTGHHTMNIGLTADALERIDILYGAAARTYGAGAFSGAINLVPKRPTKNEGRIGIEAGQFNTIGVLASQSLYKNGKGLRLTAQHRGSDGFVENTDHDLTSGDLLVVLPVNKATLKLHGMYDRKRFGALNFYTSAFPDQQEETELLFGAVHLQKQGTWNWKADGYFRQHRDRFELFRESEDYYTFTDGLFIHQNGDTAPPWYTFHNQHRTRVIGADMALSRTWKMGTTGIGAHGRIERISSNVLGEQVWNPLQNIGEDTPTYTRRDGRENLAVHIDHRYEHRKFMVDAGVLVNLNSAFDSEVLPGVDLTYKMNKQHRLFASAGKGFRLPTYTDLYYNRGGAVGSIDLLPEHNTQYELGHRYAAGRMQQTLALFTRQGYDLIDWVLLPGETVVRAQNLTALRFSGIEYSGQWLSADTSSAIGINYTYIATDREAFDLTSLYVLDQLRHRLSVWGQRRMGKLLVRANVLWQERAGTYIDLVTQQEVSYPSNIRIDARVAYDLGKLQFYASAYNALDAVQLDRPNVVLPGRWLSGGVQVTW